MKTTTTILALLAGCASFATAAPPTAEECAAFKTKMTTGADKIIDATELSTCETKAVGFLFQAQTKVQVAEICNKGGSGAGSLGSCIDLFEKMETHYKVNKMVRCQSALQFVAARKMMCVKDEADGFCEFGGWTAMYNSMPYAKVFTGKPGYLAECGKSYPNLKGGVTGVTDSSTSCANCETFAISNSGSGEYEFKAAAYGETGYIQRFHSLTVKNGNVCYSGTCYANNDVVQTKASSTGTDAVYTIHNDNIGGYTVTLTTPGTDYAANDQIVVKGSRLNGVDGTNDATITISDAIGTATIAGVVANSYTVGDTLTILGDALGGATPANDCTMTYGCKYTDQNGVCSQYSFTMKDSKHQYVGGTPAVIADTAACFTTEMDKVCSPCSLKSTEAAVAYMMGSATASGGQTKADMVKMYDYIGKLNDASCTKVEGEGYCVAAYGAVMGAFSDSSKPAKDNPYCKKDQRCAKKFMAAYIGAQNAYNPQSGAQFSKMMDFACIINPENKEYCMDIIKGSDAPWASVECKKIPGLEGENPTTAPAVDKIKDTPCGKQIRADNAKYGCCISDISQLMPGFDAAKPDDNFMIHVFKNAGATVQKKCDLMSAKGKATLEFTGITKAWLEENKGTLKTDVMASGGLSAASVGTIEIKEVTTRRRLNDGLSAQFDEIEAAMVSIGVPASVREYHRRLAATKTTATVSYGTQEQEDTAAATKAITSGFDPKQLKQQAELDGESMAVTGVTAENIAPEKKKSRLGTWADWMHQGCPESSDGNPWWCATLVFVGSGAFIVLTVVAAVGITILIVVKKKKDAAAAAELEKPHEVTGVVMGSMTTNPDDSWGI